jgi:hypothetical protein
MTESEKLATKEPRLAKSGVTVELIKGEEWRDDLSGISLYRGFYRLASQKELKGSHKNSPVSKLGYIREEKEPQPTAVLPLDVDLTRVEKALRMGILKIYDPKNPTIYKERVEPHGKVINDIKEDRGFRYADPEDDRLEKLLKMKHPDFVVSLKDFKSYAMLEKIYEAECEGRNAFAAPRKNYIDAIKTRMMDGDVSGVGKVKSRASEVVKLV